MRHTPEWREGCSLHYHDTYSAYNYGCRCPKAVEQAWRYDKLRRSGRHQPLEVPAFRVQRRIQALCAIGWSTRAMDRYVGFPDCRIATLCRNQNYVYLSTFHKIDAMFRDLCMTPGPSKRARDIALNKGWIPPLGWDDIDDADETPCPPARTVAVLSHDRLDEVAIQRAIDGHRTQLSRAETDEAVRSLIAKGMTELAIAERLGITGRTVSRSKARIRSRSDQADAAA